MFCVCVCVKVGGLANFYFRWYRPVIKKFKNQLTKTYTMKRRSLFPFHTQSFSPNVTSKNNFLWILQGIGEKYTHTHTQRLHMCLMFYTNCIIWQRVFESSYCSIWIIIAKMTFQRNCIFYFPTRNTWTSLHNLSKHMNSWRNTWISS